MWTGEWQKHWNIHGLQRGKWMMTILRLADGRGKSIWHGNWIMRQRGGMNYGFRCEEGKEGIWPNVLPFSLLQVWDGINRSFGNLSVDILDVNDNGPVFKRAFIQMELAKGTAPGTLLAKMEANDADGTEKNSRINYEIYKNNYEEEEYVEELFMIERKTGLLNGILGI
jgi:hypothetical protein